MTSPTEPETCAAHGEPPTKGGCRQCPVEFCETQLAREGEAVTLPPSDERPAGYDFIPFGG